MANTEQVIFSLRNKDVTEWAYSDLTIDINYRTS